MTDLTLSPTRHISNSEVGSWNTCKMLYRYQFDLSLEPVKFSEPLSKGILGHDAIAAYYRVLKFGGSLQAAEKASQDVLMISMNDTARYDLETITAVDMTLRIYYERVKGDIPNWEILEVEAKHDLPLTDNYSMPLRLDALVRDKRTDKIILVDHKFTYNFWSEDDLALNPQFPKYLGALRNDGIPVDHCILNQIRTRKLKAPGPDDLLRRTIQKPSNAKVRRALQEHIIASEEITTYRNLPDNVRPNVATRVLNKMVCRGCMVRSLCMSEFDGGDITYLAQNDYRSRSYGYNNDVNTPSIEDLMN